MIDMVLILNHPGMTVVDAVAEWLRRDRAAMLATRYPKLTVTVAPTRLPDDAWFGDVGE